MEISFSPKSHTLALLNTHFVSSSIRRDFLGCSHNLRPPGLRPRKFKKLKIRENKQSQTLLINASFGLDSVLLVVAVSTVSVFSFAYLNQYFIKRKSSKQALNDGLSQLGRTIASHIVRSPFLDLHKVNRKATYEVKGKDLLVENSRDTEQSYVIENGNGLSTESSVLVETVKSDIADDDFIVSSNVCTFVVPKENDASSTDFFSVPVPAIHGSETVLPLEFARGLSESTIEKSRSENEVDSEWSQLLAENSNAGLPSLNDENDTKDYLFDIIKESARDELYKFYEENQLNGKAPSNVGQANVNGSSTVPPHVTNLNGILSPQMDAVVKETEESVQQSPKISESGEKKIGHARYERSSSHKNGHVGGRRGFPREKTKVHQVHGGHSKLPEFPYPNGVHLINKGKISEQVYDYNHLIKNGRLAECVDLLEDMERKGSLDMNKIYHAKFFKTFKMKKAVKEAFRFCKLIPNPTLSTFNMLMSVCASSQDAEGGFEVLKLAQGADLKPDCKLYTTLISTCAKSGKVDTMFEVFHEMVNAGIEPNVHTYGALIDGCARAGQMAKAFGAYGILRSKNVKPDRVVFNALITACGQSGAVDRAFDVLAEMGAETHPVDPDHVTIGALMKACGKAGQVDRAKEVYNMLHKYKIKGTPEVYTIAVNCCSQTGDWEFASKVYEDMTKNNINPDEMFLSALIDVAGHAGMVDIAFETLQEARNQGTKLGIVPYSSLMGACCNAKNWQKAVELYEYMKAIKLKPTVITMNALITSLCDGDQLSRAIEILSEMKSFGLFPNTVTYSILIVASERKDDLDTALMLLSQAKENSVAPTLVMYKCIIGMCLRRYEKACSLGEPILSSNSGQPQLKNEWTSLALTVYREIISAGEKPTMEVVSQVLGCLQLPFDSSLKGRLVENLGVTADPSKKSNLCALVDGFGEYDPRAFSLLEEASSLGVVPGVSFKESLIVIDAKSLKTHIAAVYFLTILRGLKHRLAAGARLPSVTILLPIETTQIKTPTREKTINLAGRLGQDVASLLRRLGLAYQGNESFGKIRINGISLKRWLQPKLSFPFNGRPDELSFSLSRLGKGISHQQRNIRTGNLSLD